MIIQLHPLGYARYSGTRAASCTVSIGCNPLTLNPEPGIDQFKMYVVVFENFKK